MPSISVVKLEHTIAAQVKKSLRLNLLLVGWHSSDFKQFDDKKKHQKVTSGTHLFR